MKLTPGTVVAAVVLILTLVPFLNGQENGSNSTEPGTQIVPEVRISLLAHISSPPARPTTLLICNIVWPMTG